MTNKRVSFGENRIQEPKDSNYGSIPNMIVFGGDDETSALLEGNKQKGTSRAAIPSPKPNSSGENPSLEYLAVVLMMIGALFFMRNNQTEKLLSNMVPVAPAVSFLLDDSYDELPLFYSDQTIDHFDRESARDRPHKRYSQRYYKRSQHFKGPGHPILLIMGGEAALELPMLYPFVNEGLASTFGAFVVSPEHRFYGHSQPVGGGYPTVHEMMAYLSPDQALEDAIQLVGFIRSELGCHPNKAHPNYCPVITFGGSYPGFLSGMLRFKYPDIIDGSYASSAPLELYSQEVDASAYFDKITSVADEVSEGCSDAVRSTLYDVRDELLSKFAGKQQAGNSVAEAVRAIGFCSSTFPTYITDIEEFVSETIQYLVPAIFADFNMGYYPPGPEKALARACSLFQEEQTSPMGKIRKFFDLRNEVEYGNSGTCFDVSLEIPAGPNARIRASDNSGSGGGLMGRIWEFQCCKDLIVKAGYSEESMFLPRPFSYEWHKENCLRRFPGMTINPYRLRDEWGFSNLTSTSRIFFANGMKDGWSAASITDVSKTEALHELSVINFPNGAHHSELKSGPYPNPNETKDILEGYQTVTDILSSWLDEIRIVQEEHE